MQIPAPSGQKCHLLTSKFIAATIVDLGKDRIVATEPREAPPNLPKEPPENPNRQVENFTYERHSKFAGVA